MPVIINEILIRSTVENNSPIAPKAQDAAANQNSIQAEELVKQAVDKVLEILEEKKASIKSPNYGTDENDYIGIQKLRQAN